MVLLTNESNFAKFRTLSSFRGSASMYVVRVTSSRGKGSMARTTSFGEVN